MGLFGKKSPSADSPAVPFEIWGQRGWHNVDVVGESFHVREIRALLPKGFARQGAESIVPVQLIHNPNNPHDRNAIEVRASTGLLGYLSREDAARYARTLATLQENGWVAITTARIWGDEQEDWENGKREFVGSVRVDLPEPHMLVPANSPPTGAHQILPVGSAIQVTGEEKYMSSITPYLNAHGECWVHATLHEVVEQAPRSSKTLAEVRLDGNPAGRLTPKLSNDMLPVVNFLGEHGQATCVRAIVKGNRLKAEVVLHALRAYELPADWFNAFAQARADFPAENSPTKIVGGQVAGGQSNSSPGRGDNVGATTPPLPPAGWYEDPQGAARLRYWDGAAWTEHTAP